MLYIPKCGQTHLEDHQGVTTNEYGVSVAAGGSAHTKNATYTQLIASTAYDAYGISIFFYATAVVSTRTGVLVDIAIGAASSEQVIIPNLIAGNAGTTNVVTGTGHGYYFPIMIPKGSRISATAQAFTASDTVNVHVYLHQHPMAEGAWYGQRVTAYGADTATSSGTSMSPGNDTYATPVSVAASTANPIKFLQLGTDLLTDTTASTSRGLIQISTGTTPDILANDLPYQESTTIESISFLHANLILSHMMFNIPAGVNLKVAAMRNATAEARGWVLYGVD